jgi:hypothetical protein
MAGQDWMPRRRADQLAMAKNWAAVLAVKAPAWDIPAPEVAILNRFISEAQEAFNLVNSGSRTPAATEHARNAFANLVDYMRMMRSRKFFVPPLTSVDIVSLGLRPRDEIRTPHIDVTEVVEFELKLRNIREVLVNFWIKGQTHRAKPTGYDGAVIVWDVLDSPPANPHVLTQHTMASRTSHALEFDEEDRGKTVYIALAWQNERGLTGQWSEIQSAVIP